MSPVSAEGLFSLDWYDVIYTLHNARIFILAITRMLNAKQTLE